MMETLDPCCLSYVAEALPNNPLPEVFTEIHGCPTCDRDIEITFEELPVLGEGAQYAPVGAEYVNELGRWAA